MDNEFLFAAFLFEEFKETIFSMKVDNDEDVMAITLIFI